MLYSGIFEGFSCVAWYLIFSEWRWHERQNLLLGSLLSVHRAQKHCLLNRAPFAFGLAFEALAFDFAFSLALALPPGLPFFFTRVRVPPSLISDAPYRLL